jgi:hypothetical protein
MKIESNSINKTSHAKIEMSGMFILVCAALRSDPISTVFSNPWFFDRLFLRG